MKNIYHLRWAIYNLSFTMYYFRLPYKNAFVLLTYKKALIIFASKTETLIANSLSH